MSIDVSIEKELDGFSLDIGFHTDSKRIGILGASGSGKSLSLKCLAGISEADRGRIVLDDRILFDSEKNIDIAPRKRGVGYLFQHYALFPRMSAGENIACGLSGLSRREKRERVSELLSRFNLEGLGDRLPSELSGGQQQRVALARIIAYKPQLILLDEPFSALDLYIRDRMEEELRELLSDYDGYVIMVSHSRDELYRFSEELLIINDGKIERQGEVREVFSDPVTVNTARLTGCKNISRARKSGEHSIKALDWGIELFTERALPPELSYVGLRAHHFKPIYGEREKNCIALRLSSIAELPFERNYYIKPEGDSTDNSNTLCWFVQGQERERIEKDGLPDYLSLPEDKLLLLKG